LKKCNRSGPDEFYSIVASLDNDDIISYVLAGLDEDYDGFVASVNALLKVQKTISMGDLYSMFLACEDWIENQNRVVDPLQMPRLEEAVDTVVRMAVLVDAVAIKISAGTVAAMISAEITTAATTGAPTITTMTTVAMVAVATPISKGITLNMEVVIRALGRCARQGGPHSAELLEKVPEELSRS
jgi:hypothetical protein